jgi:hypothetical protein
MECAEYSLAQASDPAAAKLLQELELGNVGTAEDDAPKEEVDNDDDDDDDDDDNDDDDDDLEEAELEQRWYNKLSFTIHTMVG